MGRKAGRKGRKRARKEEKDPPTLLLLLSLRRKNRSCKKRRQKRTIACLSVVVLLRTACRHVVVARTSECMQSAREHGVIIATRISSVRNQEVSLLCSLGFPLRIY